jgi:hypothetical protein
MGYFMLVSQARLMDWDWLVYNADTALNEYSLSDKDMEYECKEISSSNIGYGLQLDLFDLQDVPF